MGWMSKKNTLIALAVMQGAYLFGIFKFLGTAVGNTGITWDQVFGAMSIGVLYITFDTFGSR